MNMLFSISHLVVCANYFMQFTAEFYLFMF